MYHDDENILSGYGDDAVVEDEQLTVIKHNLKIRETIYRLFTSTDGKFVLDYLKEEVGGSYMKTNSLFFTSMPVGTNEFLYLREGQSTVIEFIKKVIEAHEQEMKEKGNTV